MSTQPTAPKSHTLGSISPKKKWRFKWIARHLFSVGIFFAAGIGLIFVLGVAQKMGWISPSAANTTDEVQSFVASDAVFTCPMHTQIRQPRPGRCPICGMALVPASSTTGSTLDELAVRIEPAQRRLANIQVDTVKKSPVEVTIQTVGSIAIDESRQATIAAYVDGRLERLFADYTGVDIKKGDHLAVIYSPKLFSAQVEYIEARRASNLSSGLPVVRQAQEALAANTKQRLKEYGMTAEQLSELDAGGEAQSRLTIYAPQGGTVVEKLAVEGGYVEAGDPIYRIAELSTVWLMLKLFPEDAAKIRFGQRVEAVLHSLPGEKRLGRVAFIDPVVDPKTRSVGVRVELQNEKRQLRPGDYADAQITLPIGPSGQVYDADLANKWISPMHPQIIREEPGQCPICGMELVPTSRFGFANEYVQPPESIHVPRSAVLMAGGRSIVYVETSAGRFEIRPVSTGPILRDLVVILEGLAPGETVATSGNFLIDSQMQLAGKPSLIDLSRIASKPLEMKGPLVLERSNMTFIQGEAGQKLQSLYASYFEIQNALASDKASPLEATQNLHKAASELSREMSLPENTGKLFQVIASKSEHLHHMDIEKARQEFKLLSHAVVTLASQMRGEGEQLPFTHFYCPMVPGGGGDWLQADGVLSNPYFGSEMPRCGEKVQEFSPTKGSNREKTPTDHGHDHAASHNGQKA